jgi:hypothetical protein
MSGNPQTRLNVNINSQTAAALKDYAAQHDVSVTEALRRLVNIGAYILEARDSGKDVLFRDGHDTEKVVFKL